MLKAVNAYPVPHSTLTSLCVGRGLDPEGAATAESLQSREYRLTRADLLMWLADAPNVSQGGQSFTFSEDQRQRMRQEAQGVLDELDGDNARNIYGYKGDRL